MNGNIIDEREGRVGIRLRDSLDHEHEIEVDRQTGKIEYHTTDYYPEPTERTDEEDDTFSQARRFARYHVYREKGCDVLPATENPDRIAATLFAVLDLTDEQFEEYVRTGYEQAVSHERPDVVPPLDLPDPVYDDGKPLYKQNVYLAEDLDAIRAAVGEQPVQALGDDVVEELVSGDREGYLSAAASVFDPTAESITDLSIEGVSGIDTMYFDDDGKRQTIDGDDPFDRAPDARLELNPTDLDLADFRFYVGLNLVCQIRDCFIGMGIDPPAQYRVLGQGKYKYSRKYMEFDFYPDYWDHEARISGYVSPV